MTYLSDEVWKDIPSYEGIYQASNFGNIRTVEGKTTFTEKHGTRHWRQRTLKQKTDKQNSKRVTLWKDGKSKEHLVARLVAAAFHGLPPEGYTVNHIDGNRLNNCEGNLEWLSLGDNIRHGFENNLYSNQTSISVQSEDGITQEFRSMSSLDSFLGRRKGYTSNRLKKQRTNVVAASGEMFRVI